MNNADENISQSQTTFGKNVIKKIVSSLHSARSIQELYENTLNLIVSLTSVKKGMIYYVEELNDTNKVNPEIWQRSHFHFLEGESENISPKEFKKASIAYSNRKLLAEGNKGFIVDTGRDIKKIDKSSEWIFGTKLNKVVKFLNDSTHDGYWIATDSTGLLWSDYPF